MKQESKARLRSLAILGDSYSTYAGWIPADYGAWYSDEGPAGPNDMRGAENTWWYIFMQEKKLRLLTNCSYGGSTVCNTGYEGCDASGSSFITRMKRELGEGRGQGEQPDLLIIFGGTNDCWAGSPLGELKYGDWTKEDLQSFAPAFCYMLDYLLRWNPNTQIVNVVNDYIFGPIPELMAEACAHYGIQQIRLDPSEKETGHPNLAGMRQIAQQLAREVVLC